MQLQNILLSDNTLSFSINYNVDVVRRRGDNQLLLSNKKDKGYELDSMEYTYHLTSILGEEDIMEDIRQLCIYKYKPDLINSYLRCANNERLRNLNADFCFKTFFRESKEIENCFNGSEGIEMLANNAVYNRHFKVISDVAVLVNNRVFLQEFNISDIHDLLKTRN